MYRLVFDIYPDTGEKRTSLFGAEVAENREKFDLLYSLYDIAAIRTTHPNHVTPLKQHTERTCRFCGRSYGTVKFKKDAHLMPELLGNKVLFSDFECDICNALFGSYENHLANYLGILRVFNGIIGKEGIPKFKSPDKSFLIERGEMQVPGQQKGLIIESVGEDKEHFTFDAEKLTMTVHAPRHSYRPFFVYKAFLKMALSLIRENEVDDYLYTMDLLQNLEGTGEKLKLFSHVLITAHKGPAYPSPTMLLFRKKADASDKAYPTHIFCLLFENYMFQIHVPFNKADQWMYDGKQTIKLIYVPPFLDTHFVDQFGKPKATKMDCSSVEKAKGSVQNFSFTFGGYEEKIFDEFGKVVQVNTNL